MVVDDARVRAVFLNPDHCQFILLVDSKFINRIYKTVIFRRPAQEEKTLWPYYLNRGEKRGLALRIT